MRALAALLTLGAAASAAAQTFSPGELSRAHASLDGIENCKKCHVSAGQPGPKACLSCHRELATRVDAGRGLHGRMPQGERNDCSRCHPEHQGRDFALVDWGAGVERFLHERTGYVLDGKHVKVKCESCHDPRRVVAPDVKGLLVARKGRKTYLGLPTECGACHFDEHRGQVKGACERCHDLRAFKPAPRFSHQESKYPLSGKHQALACVKCHPAVDDTSTAKDAFPAPVARTYARLTGVAHESCRDCHKDAHGGKLGRDCERCHVTDGWRSLKPEATAERGFHDKTRYPLRGGHARVTCARCHGPFSSAPARFKGLPFDACSRCHFDAHAGQLAPGKEGACERCHVVEGFSPVRFELEDHDSGRYPLRGAHRAVPCSSCHPKREQASAASADLLRAAARRGQVTTQSAVRLRFDAPLERCESCHADPHAGQFASGADGGDCRRCHELRSFRALKLSHAETRFALEGKHAKAACASCHRAERVGEAMVTRYRPLAVECAACHRDVHLGQLARDGVTDCARCHDVNTFRPSRFSHAEAAFSDFRLEGKHAAVPCAKCHVAIAAGSGRLTRYRPVPRECEACHVDVHRGAFAGLSAETLSAAAPPRLAGADGITRCAACHEPGEWLAVSFPHERTGFPLRGVHEHTGCLDCHLFGIEEPMATSCASCHRDPHAGELGQRCEGCHAEQDWRARFDADAHRRTVFPLVGRHAVIPCTECHGEQRDRGFSHAVTTCYDCHARDYERTALTRIDHRSAGFGTDCQTCHEPWRFAPASFMAHERCFAIHSGPHAGVRCLGCHSSLAAPLRASGACSTNSASCTGCHEHRCGEVDDEHRGVAGYQCKDRKCYECHRFTP